jgi:hypothetical protein
MPGWAGITPYVGAMPESIVPATLDQRHPLGTRITAYDSQGAFGAGEFMYGKTVAAIVGNGRLVVPDYDGAMIDLPSAAGQGFPVAVGMGPMAANSFGWFQLSGLLVCAGVSVAIGAPIGIGAAGAVGANSAGKQLLGGRVVQPATYAVGAAGPTQKTGSGRSGSKQIRVNDTAWVVPGLVVSGTGIAGGSKVVSVESDGATVNLDLATTGAVSGFITFTYTGFVIISAPNGLTAQGAIT